VHNSIILLVYIALKIWRTNIKHGINKMIQNQATRIHKLIMD